VSRRLRFARTRTGAIGLVLLAAIVLLALFGPFFAPHAPAESLGRPGAGPSGVYPLGLDFLGRDVLSRALWGGRSVLGLAIAATAVSYALGLAVGLTAGYSRSFVDPALMRSVDVVRAFPPLLFFLILVTGVGTSVLVLVLGVAVVQSPGIARLVHTATKEVSYRGYVEAAVARGEHGVAVVRRDVLPNIMSPLIADAGLRFTFSILLVAAVNFLGLGLRPPAADWALMISENRQIITLNPWSIFVPAALIALLTIAMNLVGDSIARSLGRSEGS
jgi:ABC-type dipeptide/oligopeptide/nickel transport system permease subunit